MGLKGKRRARQQRKELTEDIDAFLERQNRCSVSAVVKAANTELFSVDTTGSGHTNAGIPRTQVSGRGPVRQLPKAKKKGGVKKVRAQKKSRRTVKQPAEAFFDIWGEAEKAATSNPDAPKIRKGDRLPQLGKGPRPKIPAVVIDAPGCSFNPEPVQHQTMLAKKESYEYMRQKTKVSALTEIEVLEQETAINELEEFNIKQEESEVEAETTEARVVHRPKIPERKTKAQRNKEARHRKLLKDVDRRKQMKKFHAQIDSVKAINKQITKQIKLNHERNLQRKASKKKQMERGLRRLGHKVIYNSPLEVQSLEDAAAACLRRLHVSNDMALHRYASLQKRGKVDAGRFRGRKNKKRYAYQHVGQIRRELNEAKEEIPILQKRVQELHNRLQKIKLEDSTQGA